MWRHKVLFIMKCWHARDCHQKSTRWWTTLVINYAKQLVRVFEWLYDSMDVKLPFSFMYLCEAGFSPLTATKTKLCSRVDGKNTLHLSVRHTIVSGGSYWGYICCSCVMFPLPLLRTLPPPCGCFVAGNSRRRGWGGGSSSPGRWSGGRLSHPRWRPSGGPSPARAR